MSASKEFSAAGSKSWDIRNLSRGWQCLILVLATLAIYAPTIGGGFFWDDFASVTGNPWVQARDGLRWIWFSTAEFDYLPITNSVFWLEWRIWGMNAAGYHAFNVFLHLTSALLLWRVAEKLKLGGAWLIALIFAIHPVNVASVAWIAELKNTLSMVFFLATFLAYFAFETGGKASRYWLALVLFALALLSKSSVVMLPCVLLVAVWWQRRKISTVDVRRAVPFFALSLLSGLVTIWFQNHRAIAETAVEIGGVGSRIAVAGRAVWFYVSKAVVPVDLCLVYPRWEVNGSHLLSYLPALLLLSFLLVCWWKRARWGSGVLFGLGYFVLTLFPVLGFFKMYYMNFSFVADQWLYLPIPGVIALMAAPFATRSVLQIVLAIAFAVLGFQRALLYADPVGLWMDTLEKNPRAWVADLNLGALLLERGRTKEAGVVFSDGLKIKPDNAALQYNAGLCAEAQGDPHAAMAHYESAVRLNPDYVEAHAKLGALLMDEVKSDEALSHLRRAVDLDAESALARNNLGSALLQLGKIDDAILQLTEAVRLRPGYAKAHVNLATALEQKGRGEEALKHREIAGKLKAKSATR